MMKACLLLAMGSVEDSNPNERTGPGLLYNPRTKEDDDMYASESDYDRIEPLPEEGWGLPDKRPEDDEFGHWVWDEYGWDYELNWLGIACAAEDDRVMCEAMAEQHYAELAAKQNESQTVLTS